MSEQRQDQSSSLTKVPKIGKLVGGGYYAGAIRVEDKVYGVIVSPKKAGDFRSYLTMSEKTIKDSGSFCNGKQNTGRMLAADCDLAKRVCALTINGYSDWHIPSKFELDICYRAFKPTSEHNIDWGEGANPCSVPPLLPYVETFPLQTECALFERGGPESFEEMFYWTSTLVGQWSVWMHSFSFGDQNTTTQQNSCQVRAVRWIDLTHLFE